ncbi:conserved hypothetical protein [delta proteobacterium NaphS2]|nr:conserved hypothetical protein [delta proteobacterium NaphS2]
MNKPCRGYLCPGNGFAAAYFSYCRVMSVVTYLPKIVDQSMRAVKTCFKQITNIDGSVF